MATHSSILAWRIPLTEGPGELQSPELQKVEHHLATNTHTHTHTHTHIHTRDDSKVLMPCEICLTLVAAFILPISAVCTECL